MLAKDVRTQFESRKQNINVEEQNSVAVECSGGKQQQVYRSRSVQLDLGPQYEHSETSDSLDSILSLSVTTSINKHVECRAKHRNGEYESKSTEIKTAYTVHAGYLAQRHTFLRSFRRLSKSPRTPFPVRVNALCGSLKIISGILSEKGFNNEIMSINEENMLTCWFKLHVNAKEKKP
uniref:Uncharacterized protein n=1 Tax=Setaria digitata TaxID=48799 RepID=A0A915PMV4_9BILA